MTVKNILKKIYDLLRGVAGWIEVRITDGTTVANVDISSKGLTTSRATHYRVEHSNQWISSVVFPAVDSGDPAILHIKTGGIKNPHGVIRISSAAKVTYYIYENPTLTDNGGALTSVSQNRQSVSAADTDCFHSPTITDNGTLIEIGIFGTAGKFTAVGAQIDNGGYWLFKKSESYLVVVVNDDDAARDISIAYMWHEE